MYKTVKLIRLNPVEDEVVINWYGFVPGVYSWVQINSQEAHWIHKTNGATLVVNSRCLFELLNILFEVGYNISNDLKRLYDKSKNVCTESRFVPRDYQLDDAKKMLQSKKILNASEMGTGKTATAILASKEIEGRILIICPATLKYTWAAEIVKIDIDAKVYVASKKNTYLNAEKYSIYSYDEAKKNDIEAYNFKCVILDEAHYMKAVDVYGNASSQRAKACIDLCKKAEYVFLLTGTPMPSFVRDLFNLLCVIDAKDITFDGDFLEFSRRYCNRRKKYIGANKYAYDVDGSSNISELSKKLKKYYIRRKRQEVLPDMYKVRHYIPVNVNSPSKFEINLSRFRLEVMTQRQNLAIAKTKETTKLARDLLETTNKIVIVSCFLGAIDKLKCSFDDAVLIKGNMSAEDRFTSIEQFQNGDARVCIISLTAGGVGITLTAASVVIFNDFDFVPANMLQTEDRICRIGQKKQTCDVFYIIANNVMWDYLTARIVNDKMQNVSNLLNGQDITNELLFDLIAKEKGGESNE